MVIPSVEEPGGGEGKDSGAGMTFFKEATAKAKDPRWELKEV